MATKLFALENNDDTTSDSNELLIDKVLRKKKEEKAPLSLTADILKQRQELQQEITDQLEKAPDPDNTEDNPDNNENTEPTPESEPSEKTSEDKSTPDNKTEDKPEENKPPKNDDESDELAAADDKDHLSSLVGSANKDKSNDKPDNKTEDTKKSDETSTESLKPQKAKLSNIFQPLIDKHRSYCTALESYGLGGRALAIEEQPVVYVKDAVVKSLNGLVEIANSYIKNNVEFTEGVAKSIKDLNERVTVFTGFVEARKYSFNHKLVTDKDLLKRIACPGKTDIRETVRVLLKFIENSNKAMSLSLTNRFEDLPAALSQADYVVDGEDYKYKEVIPGFGVARVHLGQYKNYTDVNIEDYHYYKLTVLKTDDLYDLNGIALTEDKELDFIVASFSKLIAAISLSVDNLNDVTEHFKTFIDQLKVMIVDVTSEKVKDLASLKIDDKVKDFIRFKLTMESLFINVNTMIEYMVTVMTVLNTTVELRE